jgi:hypothetical protein
MSSFESESTFWETDNEQSILQENLIPQIAKIINNLINFNEEDDEYIIKVMEQSNLKFHSNYLPNISLEDYITRIKKYSQIDDATLISALIYIDRLIKKGIFISQYNIYRIFLACVFISNKLLEDKRYKINEFSIIGGVSKEELFNLEYEFVTLIDFNLNIDEKEFYKYQDYLNNKILIKKLDGLIE